MALFSGTHLQSFDAKGRVSVPAPFRAALREDSDVAGSPTGPISIPLVLRPSEKGNYIEAWTQNQFNALRAELDKFDRLSEEREAMATVLFGDADMMETDKEGRIIIDAELLNYAGISRKGDVTFIGLGELFQIWAPDAIAARKAEARALFNATFGRKRDLPA